MDNEKDCGRENDSLSPLADAEAVEGRDEGMQKYVNGDNGVLERENGEPLLSPWQSNEAENAIELEDGFAPQGSALLTPLDEQQESAPIEDASGKGGLIDSKHAADIAPTDMQPQIEGLEVIRQGEAPVEIEHESDVKASAEIQHELDGEPSLEAHSIVSDLLVTERERQDVAQPEQGHTGDSELGEGDTSGWEEYNMGEMLEQLLSDADFTTGVSQEAGDVQQGAPELVEIVSEVNPEKYEEQIQDHSASEELNEQVHLEIPIGNFSEEPPAGTVPDDTILIKEPSLSTPAMEALIDADNEDPSHEQESFGTVENSEQHLEANATHEDSAGSDRQDTFEGISNQVEVDNNKHERAESNAYGEASAESADEVLIPSGQELGTDMPSADEQDGKESSVNEQSLVFEQETEQLPINEAPSVVPHAEQELDIEAPLDVGQEPVEQSLDTAPSSSDLQMAADINEKGDKSVPLKAEDTLNADGDKAATSEVVEGDAITDSLEKTNTENESRLQALNGDQGLNNPHNKESDETFNIQLDAEGLFTWEDKSCVQMNNDALPSEGETGSSKAEAKIDAANGKLDEDNLNERVQYEQGSVNTIPCSDMEANHLCENHDKSSSLSEPSSEREHEGQGIGNAITSTQLESTTDDFSNGVMETSETPNKIHLSEHVLENGDSLQSCPSREKGIDVEGSPVLELGEVSDGTIEGNVPITALSENRLGYHGMTAEDDKQSTSKPLIYSNSESEDEFTEFSEVGTQAAEAKDRDLDAGKGKVIVGGAKGVPYHTGATSSPNFLAPENGFHKHSEGKESQATAYTDGPANTCIADDKKNAQVFYNERSREASLSLVVPQQRDRASEHVGQKDADRTNGRGTLASRTNWWGCCGMLDLLLHKD